MNANDTRQHELSDEAQFAFATLAQDCRDVPTNQNAMDNWLVDASVHDEHPDYIREIEDLFPRCLGVDRSYNYLDTFIEQAHSGNVKALERYIDVYEPELYGVLNIPNTDREAMIAARQALAQNKTRLIEANILLGNEQVIAMATWEWGHIMDPSSQFEQLTLLYYLRDHATENGYFRFANEAITAWQGVPDVSNEVFENAKQEAEELARLIAQNKKRPF